MTDKMAQKRAEASDKWPADIYLATVESIEPDVHPIDAGAFYASAAISLKRIADVAELIGISLIRDSLTKEQDMRDWAQRHGFGDLWDRIGS